ncbi:hypothetical protein BO71DRAFT_95192 [Aspergillus ellipticus CBS 707.79]|uniref:Uncharacterized protein n=1 Tax=Aspergillus ellipticus CBS 707.79 TaxID=1448320 RepID=A0A319DPE1_9EURO|nr:hypothetical protein BO71DRAFT_95192 [Aspergillus ellipticus CBS 707.79]
MGYLLSIVLRSCTPSRAHWDAIFCRPWNKRTSGQGDDAKVGRSGTIPCRGHYIRPSGLRLPGKADLECRVEFRSSGREEALLLGT